ncbi:50S rRNA methyltransferase [Marichromatium purpuratum 984]|uniref:Dual-specificity RNA methyltransferase RlmN n=1 Tax=Marichromatium purpuratum 984 TaxID=765910 RepID=W0E1P4_MARPU|nr:bifunctional tRNA (adenosine(37)-C2)-methyltransferase TrmG/ribosomal RNA large subunit methyltransferase RlmN [Marichromatium purpuratum]AHF04642.1 50S rRNA methyltransferase [Marichromatium purpuratum 984]
MNASETKTNLLDLDRADCEALAVEFGRKAFHGRNLFKWIHKHGVVDFDAMTDLPLALRQQLRERTEIRLPRIVHAHPSADGTIKWVMELTDGQHIETVFIPEGRRSTICVSSQVGCALDCRFCATAKQGFNRNLAVSEIIAQVWHATRHLQASPTNVVMMGMGEPLANFDAVVKAMAVMQDDLAYMLAKQRVTVSTVGIVPAIERLREVSDVSLAVSLHAPNDALRNELVPINRKYPLAELIPACRRYVAADKRRKVTWEYIMIAGLNDSIAHAKQLIRLLEGTPSKINLIPFNPFPGVDYATSPPEQVEAFRQRLIRSGLIATTRKTRGEEIAAACGQLVGRVQDRTRRQAQVQLEQDRIGAP